MAPAAAACLLAYPVLVLAALVHSVAVRKPAAAPWGLHPAAVCAGAAYFALLLVLPAVELVAAYWIFCGALGLCFLACIDAAWQAAADVDEPPQSSRYTMFLCRCDDPFTTRFDICNPLDWACAAAACVMDPLLLTAAGVASFGFPPSTLSPKQVAPFEFGDDASATLLMQQPATRAAGLALALAVVAAHAVAYVAQRVPGVPPAASAAATVLGGACLIPVITQLALACLSDFRYFYAVLLYLPAATFLGGAPPPRRAVTPCCTSVRFSSTFVAVERAWKASIACGCVALAAQGHDIAQAGLGLFGNVCLGGALLSMDKPCTLRGVARVRALCHAISFIGLGVTVAIRYGAENARLFGWGALVCIVCAFVVMCACSCSRRQKNSG